MNIPPQAGGVRRFPTQVVSHLSRGITSSGLPREALHDVGHSNVAITHIACQGDYHLCYCRDSGYYECCPKYMTCQPQNGDFCACVPKQPPGP
jgi:hypothetical protein